MKLVYEMSKEEQAIYIKKKARQKVFNKLNYKYKLLRGERNEL